MGNKLQNISLISEKSFSMGNTHWKLTLSTVNLVSNIPDVNTRQRNISCKKKKKLNSDKTTVLLKHEEKFLYPY